MRNDCLGKFDFSLTRQATEAKCASPSCRTSQRSRGTFGENRFVFAGRGRHCTVEVHFPALTTVPEPNFAAITRIRCGSFSMPRSRRSRSYHVATHSRLAPRFLTPLVKVGTKEESVKSGTYLRPPFCPPGAFSVASTNT